MAQYEVTLRDYWRILRRRKGIVVFTAFLLGFFSFVLASIWKPIPIYAAAAKVQLTPSSQSIANIYLEAAGVGGGDELETQMAVVTSFPLLKRAVRELGIPVDGDTARVVLDLQNRLDVDQEGYANILVISIEDTDPARAAALVNGVARVFVQYSDEQKNQQAVKHLAFVGKQLEEAKASLLEAEDAARRYREENDIVSIDAQANVLLAQLTRTARERTSLEQVLRVIEGILKEIEEERELSQRTLQGVSREQVGDAFMAFAQQLNALRLDRDALLVKFTENHPAVREVQAKIDLMIENMANELRQRHQTIARDLASVVQQQEKLREEYGNLPARGLELGRREREVQLRQEVVTALAQEYETARIRAADRVETAKVLQEAIVPTRPKNPHNPVQRAVMGVILGLVLGVVFAVIAETLDTSIGTIEDVQEYTGAKVVGVIPFIRAESVEDSLRRRGREIESERMLQRMTQLVAYFDPQSTLAETYRTLRTNIEFVTVEKGDKVLLVTSSTSGEGKSTVMANLAMTMTQLGKRTLLVDSDLRKPTVARMFGLDKEPGLAEIIVGNYEWREVIRTVTDIVTGGMGMEDLMQTQGISNLHIITSGAIPPNPAELLNSKRMDQFIEQIKEVYDIVLFDAPPILHVTDAAILGKKIDGVLMVYKAGDIPRTSLKRSVNLLNSVGVHLLGIVLNGIRAEISADYYDFGYSSYYAYGSEQEPELSWLEKAQDFVSNWRGKGEDVDEQEDEEEEEGGRRIEGAEEGGEEEEYAAAEEVGTASRGLRLLSACLLVLAGLGVVWQSGYLQRPLGMIPVFSHYNRLGAESGAGARTSPADVVAAAGEAEAPPPATREGAASGGQAASFTTAAPSLAPPRQEAQPYALLIATYGESSRWAVPNLNALRQAGQMAFLVPGPADRLRLLVGSYADWDAAFQAGRRLRESGALSEFAPVYLPYAVELGRFDGGEETLEFLRALGGAGRYCYVQILAGGGQRVLAGAFETREEAAAALELFAFAGARAQVVRR